MNWKQFANLIRSNLTDDLLTKPYQRLKNRRPTTGHCYVASEAAYHLLGCKSEGWTPQFIRHEGQSHWFLKHCSRFILDLTADQFQSPVAYSKARGKGFLTSVPSKRAVKLIARIKGKPNDR